MVTFRPQLIVVMLLLVVSKFVDCDALQIVMYFYTVDLGQVSHVTGLARMNEVVPVGT